LVDGPQADWFPRDSLITIQGLTILSAPRCFEVTQASNRMGLRLQGTPLPATSQQLVSEPVCPGSVQVTRDGQCIILGVDGQTIGGYPKIAQVVSADLDRLGQLRPGDMVRFQRVTLEEAEALFQSRTAWTEEWLLRLRVSE